MDQRLIDLTARIADALDRLAPPPPAPPALESAEAFVWHPSPPRLAPVAKVSRVEIALLQGVERQRRLLLDNTLRFARGLPANNAMLWGARGMGKSSLVKATHAETNRAIARDGTAKRDSIALIEIHREDIRTLPELLTLLRGQPRRCLILCDDLSFEREDTDYKALKSILDGGIEGRPENVLFYATSNRRHLMARDMIENERSTAINPGEATEEKVSLSDRFGLWLGFHNCDQETYFAMVDGYASAFRLPIETAALHAEANEWSVTRGSRSGRVAWQFIQDLAGRLGVKPE
jgi:predicted AAA+ superfamily ATPase